MSDEPTAFWLHAAVYSWVAVIIATGPTLLQLKNVGYANWAAFFWTFGRVSGVAVILGMVVYHSSRRGHVSTLQRPAVARPRPFVRLVGCYVISVVAITFLVPLEFRGNGHPTWVKDRVEALALIPEFLAWLVILTRPAREDPALIRGAFLAVGFVGAGALALLAYADQMSRPAREMIVSARLPIQAKAYLVLGILGLIGSVLFSPAESEKDRVS